MFVFPSIDWSAKAGRVGFIKLTEFIQNDDDYTICINHFSKRVYADLAKKIAEAANHELGQNVLTVK